MKTASFSGSNADEQLMTFLKENEPPTYFIKSYHGRCSSPDRKITIRYEEKRIKVF